MHNGAQGAFKKLIYEFGQPIDGCPNIVPMVELEPVEKFDTQISGSPQNATVQLLEFSAKKLYIVMQPFLDRKLPCFQSSNVFFFELFLFFWGGGHMLLENDSNYPKNTFFDLFCFSTLLVYIVFFYALSV